MFASLLTRRLGFIKLSAGVLLISFLVGLYTWRSSAALPKVYGVLIYDDFTTLDVMGPLAFFNNIPGAQIFFIHDTLAPTPTRNVTASVGERYAGEFYQPVYTMDNAPPLDVLVIPGGETSTALENPAWQNYVARVYPSLKYVFSVCTGAGIAARAGILSGRNATTNKSGFKWAQSLGGNVNWIPVARWVVDGNIWTSSGVEAGTDMAYAFMSQVYGNKFALDITTFVEYVPVDDSSDDPFAAYYNLTSPSKQIPPVLNDSPFTYWALLVYPGIVALDAIGVASYPEFITLLPGFPGNLSIIAPTLDPVQMSSIVLGGGQTIIPTHQISTPPPQIDVLIVPGLPTAGPFPYQDQLAAFIRQTYPSVKNIISVGTGSMLLGYSGILEGREATTSKSLFSAATSPFKNHNITWTYDRWVQDGNVWTSSGTASGLDAGNALTASMFGPNATFWATVNMEYTPNTNSSWVPFPPSLV